MTDGAATDEAASSSADGSATVAESTSGDADADRPAASGNESSAEGSTAAAETVPTDADGADAGQRDGGAGVQDADATGTTVRSSTLRATNQWVGVAAVSYVAAGLGVATQSRSLMLAAVVGVAYLAYASATDAPTPTLSVSRRVSDASPEPGDRVEVTVAVENAGSETLLDLRVVEDVPDALAVVEGPARTATALRPGARVTFSYTVLARRGEYDLDGLTVLARNASGSRERELDLATPTTTITCVPPVTATGAVPLRSLTSPYTGRVPTDAAGEGVEFASVREYHHGDSLSRIDWNRYAGSGSLATMEFREERMATVVVLLDLRADAYVRAGEDGLHAVDRSIDAAHRLVNSLLDTGDRVGIAALSPDEVWLAPGAGPTHRARARHLLATHPALSPTPPSEDSYYLRLSVRTIIKRLPDDAQVILCSPMSDDPVKYVARSLHVRGHAVTVVSPDPTRPDTTGRLLAAVERSNRLSELRRSGVRVVDWGSDESLLEALERARRRWSA
ncbi:MAG: DUF58 domain-containing protein [Haloarculaceae archaeon]